MRSTALGLKKSDGTTLSVATQKKATAFLKVIDNAIQKALDQQTYIGSVQSRLDFTVLNLTTASENTSASDSILRDADMAKEMTGYTKANVLLQAAQSMLAQANQNSLSSLSLLQKNKFCRFYADVQIEHRLFVCLILSDIYMMIFRCSI